MRIKFGKIDIHKSVFDIENSRMKDKRNYILIAHSSRLDHALEILKQRQEIREFINVEVSDLDDISKLQWKNNLLIIHYEKFKARNRVEVALICCVPQSTKTSGIFVYEDENDVDINTIRNANLILKQVV